MCKEQDNLIGLHTSWVSLVTLCDQGLGMMLDCTRANETGGVATSYVRQKSIANSRKQVRLL